MDAAPSTPRTRRPLCHARHDSPVGPLRLVGDGAFLRRIDFPDGPKAREAEPEWVEDERPFDTLRRELDAYFAGRLRRFSVPLAPHGTRFQRAVWAALAAVPYGTTVSYGALAASMGRPNASRAVGAANGANPIPIIVPCHRVIGADGSLTGFGGGLPTKVFLLRLEGVSVPSAERQGELALT